MMTRRELLDYGRRFLKEKEVVGADTDAWLLLQYVTGLSRVAWLMAPEAMVAAADETRYKACLEKRGRHYPLQYITHTQAFMGLDFYVDENVLVPRQDTEVLVETVRSYLYADMDVLDLCTGSGCILISLAAHVPLGCGVGADLSEGALNVARMNAGLNNVSSLAFVHGDLFEGVHRVYGARKFDVIVSNPPYIASEEILRLMPEVRDHEPEMALDGHEDGLYFYRKIIAEAKNYLSAHGMIFFEIGWNQADAVSALLADAGFHQISVKKDLAGLDRVVFASND